MPHDVFISHASKDAAVAQQVLAALEARGVACWIAPRDIVAGREWEPSILTALAQARAVVLVFSGHANASAHVRREIAAAADAGVPVVPFRTDDAEMEQALRYYLHGVHWLNAAKGPLAPHLQDLTRTVATLLDRDEAGLSRLPGRDPGMAGRDSRAPARGMGASRSNPLPKTLIGLAVAAVLILGAIGLAIYTGPQARPEGPPARAPAAARPAAPRPVAMQPYESTPEALVRRLYERGAAIDQVPPTLLTPTVRAAEANRADDEERPDWRYGDVDAPPFEALTFAAEATGPRTAIVRTTWGSWPRRREVAWTLCRLSDDRWRIADVDAGGRRLRALNALPPPDPEGGC